MTTSKQLNGILASICCADELTSIDLYFKDGSKLRYHKQPNGDWISKGIKANGETDGFIFNVGKYTP